MQADEIKQAIIEVGKWMYEKQMVNAYEGNISVRIGDKVIVTPTAVCKGILKPHMLVTTDLWGNILEGSLKPSSEIKLHLAVYNMQKDLKAVIHNHSVYATAFALSRKSIESKAYTEAIMLFDKIPVAEYGAPGTDDIAKGIGKYIEQTDVMLLANHGVLAYGEDLYETFYRIEAAEKVCKDAACSKASGRGI